jgi:hydrogenase maturation protease
VSGHGVYVIGIGSVHGDDRFGWEVVSRLQTASPPGVQTLATSDPLVLTEVPHECELLVVVDGCNGAGPVGSVHRFEWPDPKLSALGALSSHAIGPGAALELAAALGKIP